MSGLSGRGPSYCCAKVAAASPRPSRSNLRVIRVLFSKSGTGYATPKFSQRSIWRRGPRIGRAVQYYLEDGDRMAGSDQSGSGIGLAPGSRIGPYEILGRLGAGGMGQVFRAVDTRLDRPVAIKIAAEQFGQRFEHE